ncbi:MAG: hypothetical protein ABIQ19_00205 [Sphingomonas sp.]
MKALFIAILVLAAADWGLNHGDVCKRVFGGVAHLISATGEEASDSMFTK